MLDDAFDALLEFIADVLGAVRAVLAFLVSMGIVIGLCLGLYLILHRLFGIGS